MGPAVLLALLLTMAGCAPPPDWSIPSALYGLAPPGHPPGATETADQVRFGQSVPQAPIRMAAGTQWPTLQGKVPTMLDLLNQPKIVETATEKTRAARQHRGGFGLCLPHPPQTPSGHALGVC